MAKVFVVAHEPDLREMLVEELEESGHQVFETCDGAEGLATIEAESPDVIVSDIGMPRMDGYQLRERLLDFPCCSDTPSFFVSASHIEHVIHAGIKVKLDAYLTKPMEFNILKTHIDACAA